jgi:hypothetical protein
MEGSWQYRGTEFRRACEGGACVEVALGEFIFVRHSEDPEGSVLVFTRTEWAEFLNGAKAGMFDIG